MPWPGLAPSGYNDRLTVVCMDLSSSDDLAAFREDYTSPGVRLPAVAPRPATAYDAVGLRRRLVPDLASDLARGTVALGLEGPCWGHADGLLGPHKNRPFEPKVKNEAGYTVNPGWFGIGGGPAALKAFTLLRDLLVQLRTAIDTVTYGIVGPRASIGEPGTLWLWEAYVTGLGKTSIPLPDSDAAEDWCLVDENGETTVKASTVSSPDIADAFLAVRYGFANNPTRAALYQDIAPVVVPIIGPALASANLVSSGPGWWDEPCVVVAPAQPNGELLWP